MKNFIICLTTFYIVFFGQGAYAVDPIKNFHIKNTQTDYGNPGSYTMGIETFENSIWKLSAGAKPVTVLFPAECPTPVPVLFYSHGFRGTDWRGTKSLFTHLVSRGFAVVHSPYPSLGMTHAERYQILWNGFQEAVDHYATKLNLKKVGFIGHSYGAGAVPAMAWKGLVEKGWGTEGAFLFILAPWYSYDLSDTQLENFPKNLKMIMQVYNEDVINDHRMAIDIFTKISIPDSEKAYYNVVEGDFEADHSVPSDRQKNELDHLAVWKPLDALMDYSLKTAFPTEGKKYALEGQGNHFQHKVTKSPTPVADSSTYKWPWTSIANPRR